MMPEQLSSRNFCKNYGDAIEGPASMRPEQFSSENFCKNYGSAIEGPASMRPEQFSSGNVRLSFAPSSIPDCWPSFNEAGAIQLRKCPSFFRTFLNTGLLALLQ
jgi:hypothetical protein